MNKAVPIRTHYVKLIIAKQIDHYRNERATLGARVRAFFPNAAPVIRVAIESKEPCICCNNL